MTTENRAIPYRWFNEVWNEGKEEVIDELFAEDGIAHGLADENGQPIIGPTAYKPFYKQLRGALPNVKITLDEVIAERDIVAMRFTMTGKHTGQGLGLDATHQDVSITGMSFIRVADGKIAEAWNNVDFMKMFQQMGVMNPVGKFK